jgi:glucosamine 6-phosphate synthetase-like amidotransferase/phosphosugar isomerase protein
MCGLAGLSLSPTDSKTNARTAAEALLLGIASRGRHATGAAWYDAATDDVALTKVPAPVARFLPARLHLIPEETSALLLHTRYATHGSVEERGNNHPVHYDAILGTHNGVLRNPEELYRLAGATARHEVDSEAVMALLNTTAHPAEVLPRLRGDAALAWIDLRDPATLHLARVTGRPLCIGQTTGGSLLYASTLQAVRAAAAACKVTLEYEEEVPEGTYLKVIRGMLAEVVQLAGVVADAAFTAKYAYTSGPN